MRAWKGFDLGGLATGRDIRISYAALYALARLFEFGVVEGEYDQARVPRGKPYHPRKITFKVFYKFIDLSIYAFA